MTGKSDGKRTGGGQRGASTARRDRLAEEIARLNSETQLWQCFLAAHRRVVDQLAEQILRDHQLALEWFDVLVHLADMPGMRLRQRELRDRLLLSESGVSRLLARMAKAGMISRTPADEDRRGVEIELTDKGRAALLGAVESHLQLVATLFTDRLSQTDRTTLARVLPKLLSGPSAESGDAA
jgi:DNA-binding MarR family transcriptional regulator